MYTGNVCLFLALMSYNPDPPQPSAWVESIQRGKNLQQQNRFTEAETEFRAALNASEQLPDSAKMQATALYYLATAEEDLGKLATAADLCSRAISILSRSVDAADASLQGIRIELAGLYLQSNQLPTAEKLLRQTLNAQTQAGETRTLEAGLAQDTLGSLFAHQKKLKAAEEAARRAVEILEEVGAPTRTRLAARMDLAIVLSLRRRRTEARAQTEQAAALAASTSETRPLFQSEILANLASFYAEEGRAADADSTSRQALLLIESTYGPDHSYTGWMWLARANLLRKLDLKEESKLADKRGRQILAASGQLKQLNDTVPFSGLVPSR